MTQFEKNFLEIEIQTLFDNLQQSQWTHQTDFDAIKNLPVVTREDLRKTRMVKGFFSTKTSGSTGESVKVEKTLLDLIWYTATNLREFYWRKWDFTKTLAIIRGDAKLNDHDDWGIPKNIVPVQGKSYRIGYLPISKIQKWLEEKNPHYIQSYPSIFNALDTSKISNFLDHKGTGELGGSMFSSEECGTIAIQCPDNKKNWHVMENQIVEVDDDQNMIITTTTNPYIKRYKNGDCVELGKCTCNRTLQTITKIHGRVRNMFILPNGDKKWPLIGSRDYYDKFGIKKYKAIQTSLNDVELQIICNPLGDQEISLKKLVNEWLGSDVNVHIKYVESFPNYKFEEFVSLVV